MRPVDTRARTVLGTYYRKIFKRLFEYVSLSPRSRSRGRVLISYLTEPFLLFPNQPYPTTHSSYAECACIAQVFLERGYSVDIVQHDDYDFIPQKKYSIVLDLGKNLQRFLPHLPKDCIKLIHTTASYWKFQNDAEQHRIKEIEARRGVRLLPRRVEPETEGLAYADFASGLGTQTTFDTYPIPHADIHPIPLSTTVTFPSPDSKNIEKVRKHFVWIGGGGAVHKGLDLLLDALANLPDFSLTVCGPIRTEKDFCELYRKELFENPRVTCVGRISPGSAAFKKIADDSLALVYPSCSEGQSGAVITALHAGLIPIVSRNAGVLVDGFGEYLETCSVNEIRDTVVKLSQEPAEALRKRAILGWHRANNNHTKETFCKAFCDYIDMIVFKT